MSIAEPHYIVCKVIYPRIAMEDLLVEKSEQEE
ncbi:MAG: hypothetical protein ACI9AP_000117 [Flavobacteriales bacterium]|jgi:hypothetical protein